MYFLISFQLKIFQVIIKSLFKREIFLLFFSQVIHRGPQSTYKSQIHASFYPQFMHPRTEKL